MRANNLTICVPNRGCDKNCKYCISKMTFEPESNYQLMVRNAKKVAKIAEVAEVSSILFTGKGEPFLNFYEMIGLIQKFNSFPVEIQTNGLLLAQRYEDFLPVLYREGVNIIAISIDSEFDQSMINLIENIPQYKMLVRLCLNVTSKFPLKPIKKVLDLCERLNVRQVIFRKVSIPKNIVSSNKADKTEEYIIENDGTANYDFILKECMKFQFIRETVDGSRLVGYKNMSILLSDYCIQSSNHTNDIRSLIYNQDGHLYTSWDHPGSILF